MSELDPAFDGLQPWPGALEERYREAGVWGDRNLAQWLEARLSPYQSETLLSGPGFPGGQWQSLSGQELSELVRRLAGGLRDLGLSRGDRVVMQMGNGNAFVVTLFALFELGVIPVMALPGHRRREIEHFVRLTQARAWLASDGEADMDSRELGRQLRESTPELGHVIIESDDAGPHTPLASLLKAGAASPSGSEPGDERLPGHGADPAGMALLLCSGGTTGLPKLIPRTHRDYIYNAEASAAVCELGPEDRYLITLPAAHNFPLACPGILGALGAGAGLVMCHAPSPEIAFEHIERSGATVTALVPPLVKVWLEYAREISPPPDSLRLLQVGGARLDPGVARRVHGELGCRLQQVFGMAEGLLNYTRPTDPDVLVQKTQGRPLSDFDEIKVVDSNGVDVPPGKQGELWTRGPYTLRGYYKDDEANKRSITEDGFYRSGDLVRQFCSGHLVVEGRVREVIRRGAETVSVETLESVLSMREDIRDVAVVGLPCERFGEQICAALVLTDPGATAPTLSELRNFLSEEGVARIMLPDSIEVIDELPFTAVGKIARQQLTTRIRQTRKEPEPGGISVS